MGILLLKLGYLFFKFTTIKGSKPLMSLVLTRAQHHPYFVDSVMVPTANFYNGVEDKVKMWLLRKFGIPSQMQVLNRDESIELSTYLIAEVTSVSVAIFFIFGAYLSSREKQLKKDEEEKMRIDELRIKIRELRSVKEEQRKDIAELSEIIDKLRMKV